MSRRPWQRPASLWLLLRGPAFTSLHAGPSFPAGLPVPRPLEVDLQGNRKGLGKQFLGPAGQKPSLLPGGADVPGLGKGSGGGWAWGLLAGRRGLAPPRARPSRPPRVSPEWSTRHGPP